MKKIYIVRDCGPEHNHVLSIHKTYEGALKEWNKLRLELLKKARESLEKSDRLTKEMFKRMVKNLSCEDPKEIDNYPHNTPYIQEEELRE